MLAILIVLGLVSLYYSYMLVNNKSSQDKTIVRQIFSDASQSSIYADQLMKSGGRSQLHAANKAVQSAIGRLESVQLLLTEEQIEDLTSIRSSNEIVGILRKQEKEVQILLNDRH